MPHYNDAESPQTYRQKINALHLQLEEAISIILSGRQINLGGFADDVKDLCERITASKNPEMRSVAPDLQRLVAAMDELESVLRQKQRES